jgi:hypothetical protein
MQVAKKWLEDVHGFVDSPFSRNPFVLCSLSGAQRGFKMRRKRQRWSMKGRKGKETFQIKKRNNGLLRKENLPGKDAFHFPRRPAVDHAMPCHMTTKT